jgi:hypothetical protein
MEINMFQSTPGAFVLSRRRSHMPLQIEVLNKAFSIENFIQTASAPESSAT